MSAWRGLHRPERHKPFNGDWAECLPELGGCLSECGDGDLCHCCLAAEVQRLTDALTERDRRIEAALTICEQAAKHRTAAYGLDYLNGFNDALDIVEQALRGES